MCFVLSSVRVQVACSVSGSIIVGRLLSLSMISGSPHKMSTITYTSYAPVIVFLVFWFGKLYLEKQHKSLLSTPLLPYHRVWTTYYTSMMNTYLFVFFTGKFSFHCCCMVYGNIPGSRYYYRLITIIVQDNSIFLLFFLASPPSTLRNWGTF